MQELYAHLAWIDWQLWRRQISKKPGKTGKFTARWQERINKLIPEKVHRAISKAIQKMTEMMLDGSRFFHPVAPPYLDLETREDKVRKIIQTAAYTAATEGGAAGAGGIVLGLIDFPALMAIKIKMLYSICAWYGYDAHQPAERLFMLRIFQLAFSAAAYRAQNLEALEKWAQERHQPDPFKDFDWKSFQIQYRDYIDLMKLAQLLPLAGAPVGVLANNYLVHSLGQCAMNAYRMRHFESIPQALATA